MAVILGLNIIVMFITPPLTEASGYIQWGRFMACLGAGGGLFIGVIEARTIERERAAERAVIRAEQLEYQNDQLEFFNSILRHDVLNGMTVVSGRAGILYEELDDGDHRRQAETILKWSDDVVAIVQRVRSILNALTSDIEPQLTAINLSETIRTEVERLSSTYPTTTFEVHVDDEVVVKADELVNEVFGNLLTNAVEHNDPDGLHVTITTEADDDTVTTRIADTGSGIPDDRKKAVFRRGETGHVKSTGSGFGLFFVDSMITVYGGSIEIQDTEPHGATFVIELPRASAARTHDSPDELVASA
ncbi:HAMP domain-containing sensor histidine kinase [Haladaptatus sp. DJG-WS-42]|uniref:sensor histidine kinase n=1 Tax=Haladaptatus sp. DJG-WS-42 TaxID=3120516 RepID=UPI0030D5D371